MLVTTCEAPAEAELTLAADIADQWQAHFVPRDRQTLNKLRQRYGSEALLVIGQRDIRYYSEGRPPLFFHPSMAMIRLKRLLAGRPDTMLAAARIQPGDRVIDCTMGFASDAIVFAYAVGGGGTVVALESEPLPYVLAVHGLATYETELQALRDAMRLVQPVNEDHLSYLRSQPDRSADVVYFDPMFRSPRSSASIEPLREMANSEALREEAVEEARRVARRCVLLKETATSGEFARLGFRPFLAKPVNINYGVISCE